MGHRGLRRSSTEALVKSGLWKLLNIMLTMRFALAVEMVAHPRWGLSLLTDTGICGGRQHASVSALVARTGTEIKELRGPGIDAQFLSMVKDMESEAHETTLPPFLHPLRNTPEPTPSLP